MSRRGISHANRGRIPAGGASLGPPPVITGIVPGFALTQGAAGVPLVITGTDFVYPCFVQVDGVGVSSTTFDSGTQLTVAAADIPAHAAGNATVTVLNADGQVSAGFTLVYIADVAVWCESDQLTQAGTVSSWLNLAATNPLINSVGSGFQPTYNATNAEFNGEPSITFTTATPNWLHTTNNVTYGAFTQIYVGKITSNTDAISLNVDGGDSDYLRGDNGNTMNVTKGANGSGKNLTATWAVDAGPATIVRRYNGTHASHTLRVNGVAQVLTDGAATADPGTGTIAAKWAVMARANSASPISGVLAACAFATSSMSEANAALFETYFRTKYGHY